MVVIYKHFSDKVLKVHFLEKAFQKFHKFTLYLKRENFSIY
jgi:hypothetical protein